MNLSGRQGPVVHAHFIDGACKVFAPVGIAANPQRVAGHSQDACHGFAANLHTVHIQAQRRAVPRSRQMGPGVHRQSRAVEDFLIAVEVDARARPGAGGRVQFVDRIQLLEDYRAPVAVKRRRDPGFQR